MTAVALLLRCVNSNRCLNDTSNITFFSRQNSGAVKIRFSEVNKANTDILCQRGDMDKTMDRRNSNSGDRRVTGRYYNKKRENSETDMEYCAETEGVTVNSILDTNKDTNYMDAASDGIVNNVTRKRPSPFESETSRSPPKCMKQDEVYNTNGNIDQNMDMYVEGFETPFPGSFSAYQFEPSLFSNSSIEIPSHQNDRDVIEFSNTSREIYCQNCDIPGSENSISGISNRPLLYQSDRSKFSCHGLTTHSAKVRRDSDNSKVNPFWEYPISKQHSRRLMCKKELYFSRNGNRISKKCRNMLETVNGFMLVLNSNLTVDFVSENVIDYLGYHQNELKGQALSSFIHPSYISATDYIRSQLLYHTGSRQRGFLDACHSLPIELRHGQGKNSCYRTFHWHYGLAKSDRMVALGGENVEDCVIVGVCVPTNSSTSSSSCSLMPWVVETKTLRRPRGWTLCIDKDEWLLYPLRLVGVELSRISDVIKSISHILQQRCLSPTVKESEQRMSIVCLSDADTERGYCSSCNKCGHRIKTVEEFLDYLNHSTSVTESNNSNAVYRRDILTNKNNSHLHKQLLKLRSCLRQQSRVQKRRIRFRDFFVCLYRHSIWIGARRRIIGGELECKIDSEEHQIINTTFAKDFCDTPNGTSALQARIQEASVAKYQFNTDLTFSELFANSFITHNRHCSTPENTSLQPSQNSNGHWFVNDRKKYFDKGDPERSKSLGQIEGTSYHHSNPEGQSSSPTLSILNGASIAQENQNSSTSNSSEGFNVVDFQDLDLTTEYSFHSRSGDVIMPVETGLNCVNDDVILTDMPPNNSGNSSSESNLSDQTVDPFASHGVNDFTYSFDDDFSTDGFQTFDQMLNFPSSSDTALSNDISRHTNMFQTSTNNANMELNKNEDCSNQLLMEMDDIVPENKNPFQKYSPAFRQSLSSLLQSCDGPSPANSKQRRENGKSLLRSLLNKNEGRASAVSHHRLSCHSKQFNGSDSRQQTCHAGQTKELPVPQSHSSKKRRFSVPAPTQELPLPGSVLKNAFASTIPTTSPGYSVTRRNSLTDILNGEDVLSNLTDNVNGVSYFNPKTGENPSFCDKADDPLPDDLVDLALEYCNSLDSKEAEHFITVSDDQFGLFDNLDAVDATNLTDSLTQTSYSLELGSTPRVSNESHPSSPYGMSFSTNPQSTSSASVCLPISTNISNETSRQLPLPCSGAVSSSPSNSKSKISHTSLLRQAVTSPDVDKLIEKIPLGRNLLSEKSKSFDKTQSSPLNKPTHLNIPCSSFNSNTPETSYYHQNITKMCQIMEDPTVKDSDQCNRCISNPKAKGCYEKATAVSHISISAPPSSSKKSPAAKAGVSPIKLKIPAPNDFTSRRRSNPPKQNSSSSPSVSSKNSIKSSTRLITSTNGVSVMVMRKENHRSRKTKTVSTQTDNHPGEVYPKLELSDSDYFLSPSVYFDSSPNHTPNAITSINSPSPTTPGNKSLSSHNCNVFSSSLRSLATPRDSKDVMATPSPSPSTSSTSSLSELELHLRGWGGPDSTLSSPLSGETSDASGEVPFLQRLLTGELNKDKYEKLDKDLLEKRRSNSASSL